MNDLVVTSRLKAFIKNPTTQTKFIEEESKNRDSKNNKRSDLEIKDEEIE